jgi:hypothetical protein
VFVNVLRVVVQQTIRGGGDGVPPPAPALEPFSRFARQSGHVIRDCSQESMTTPVGWRNCSRDGKNKRKNKPVRNIST